MYKHTKKQTHNVYFNKDTAVEFMALSNENFFITIEGYMDDKRKPIATTIRIIFEQRVIQSVEMGEFFQQLEKAMGIVWSLDDFSNIYDMSLKNAQSYDENSERLLEDMYNLYFMNFVYAAIHVQKVQVPLPASFQDDFAEMLSDASFAGYLQEDIIKQFEEKMMKTKKWRLSNE